MKIGKAKGALIAATTAAVRPGDTIVKGAIPAGATAVCRKTVGTTTTVLGAATVTAQGAASYTLANAVVVGESYDFLWTLTGASVAALASASATALAISGTPGAATVGSAYSFAPSVTGGSGAKTFSLTGSLLAGLSFSSLTGVVSGTPTVQGSSTFSITVTDALGATATATGLTITAGAAQLVAPLAPSVQAISGAGQVTLRITDDAASQAVRKWGIYKVASAGATPVFSFWAYNRRDVRCALANGTSGIFRVSAWNTVSESPLSPEVTASAAAGTPNPLRLIGTTLFRGTLFYEMLAADFATGSTFTVTSSDFTSLSVKITSQGAVFVYGTFSTTGSKVLTFTENLSGGGSNVSSQTIEVVERPATALSAFQATAQTLKDRLAAKPTYVVDQTLSVVDTGTAMPSGYTASHTSFPGRSGPPSFGNVAQATFSPTSTIVAAYDPVEQKATNQALPRYGGNNAVLRQRLFARTWVLGIGSDGGTAVGHFKVRYSDDEMKTWKEIADPIFIKSKSGTHYFKIDPGTVPSGTGRVWEVEFVSYTYLTDSQYVLGFGYENTDHPEGVVDTSPIATIYVDSFANGVGAMDYTKNMLRTAARLLGLLNVWNLAIPAHRYTLPSTPSYPIGLNRMGDNVLGSGDFQMPPSLELIFLNITINDFGQTDYVQAQAIYTNAILRARRIRPNALIVLTLGFWSPSDRIGTSLYNAVKAAYADAADAGMAFNDGIAAGWAVATGATGSSPYFMAANAVTVTGSITGNVLTVESGSGLEEGMYFWSGGAFAGARIYKQLTSTEAGNALGGKGTYRLDVQPLAGDVASGSLTFQCENYGTTYPIHPNPLGQQWCGQRLAAGATTLINQLAPNASSSTPSFALREDGSFLLREDGSRFIREAA